MTVTSKREALQSLRQLLRSMRNALWVILVVFIPLECQQIYLACQTEDPLISWLASMNSEWVYHLVWAILGIIFLHGSLKWLTKISDSEQAAANLENVGHIQPAWLNKRHVIAGSTALLTLLVNYYVAWNLGNHHPVYHDEYSYLFQAETFLSGRISNPRFEPAPELFDQVHVLNLQEGQFVSRYFPGVGLFLMPALALGMTHISHWLAGSLITYLISLCAFELRGKVAGWWSGIICALLPGYPLFANLLLSHHPTLLGLCWFLYWQLRMMKSPAMGYAMLAGIGLSFAMLCRPMTAAGFAFPFGIWWVFYASGLNSKSLLSSRINQTAVMGLPIIVGMLLMLFYNQATTGSYTLSAYQQYTDHYTPSHVYGFYNKSRGEAKIKQALDAGHPLPVLKNYDNWAEELTPLLALQKAFTRFQATGIWTIGIIPMIFMLIVYAQTWRLIEQRTFWILVSIASLHLAHIPYWYEGIFYWHYVLEAGVLIALLMGLLTASILEGINQLPQKTIGNWWYANFLLTAVIGYTSFDPFWSSWLNNGMSQIKYSDQIISESEQIIKNTCGKQVSLVVIKPNPSDLHLDLVVNPPDLMHQKILRARFLPEKYPLSTLSTIFPDREIWIYDVQTKSMQLIYSK